MNPLYVEINLYQDDVKRVVVALPHGVPLEVGAEVKGQVVEIVRETVERCH